MTHDDHDPAALTDAELDRLLAEAHDDLLRHTERYTDPTRGLLAFMGDDAATTGPEPQSPGHGRDLVILELRHLIRRTEEQLPGGITELRDALIRANLSSPDTRYLGFLLTLTQAVTAANATHNAFYRSRDVRDFTHDHDLTRAVALALDLARDFDDDAILNHALSLAYARADGLDHAVDRALDRHYVLDCARSLVADLCQALANAPAVHLARDFKSNLGLVRVRAHAVGLARKIVRTHHLGLIDDLAGTLVHLVAATFDSAPLDLSGVNLSHLKDMDLEALAGAVWTRATTWPTTGIRELVEQHSEEIGDGVFQVRRGTEHDPHDSVLA
ncbi:hypothetical protein [Actinomadura sp. KC216]|uniref:hypothetical protein n=1 Tax=Actinomadura sp. KC216 TaxID=2530370 RepID=UPI0014044D35|nr:hypothetical protein [Actinomadura sp. KC216]